MRVIVLFLMSINILLASNQFCIITEEDAIVTKHYTNDIKVTIANKFGYGFEVGKKAQTKLSIVKGGNTIGWIDEKDIVCSKHTSNNPYIDSLKVKALGGKDSMLYKKAFITNSVFSIDNTSTAKTLPRYASSTSKMTNGQSSNLYEIYFIIKEKNNRLLLSKIPTLHGNQYKDNRHGTLIGWMNKNDLKIWNSRIAIEPTTKHLKAFWEKDFRYDYKEPIEQPIKHYSLRYPLLEKLNNGIKISYMQKEGAFSYERDTFAKVMKQKEPNVIFLIDATAGMQNYMENVRNAIIDYLKLSDRVIPKVAVALYRDYSDKEEVFDLLTKNGFVSPKEAIRFMQGSYFKAKSSNDSVGDIYNGTKVTRDRSRSEALFNGIITLSNSRKLKLDSYANPTRLILIGDHGNHLNDDKGYTVNKVVDALKSNKVVINAIQVHTDEPQSALYVERFRNQIKEINRLNDNSGELEVDNLGSRETIKKAIVASVNRSVLVRKIVKNVLKKGGNNLTDEEKRILVKELKIDADNLGKVQQSLELYVSDNQKNKYKKVILSQSDFADELASAYTTMARSISAYDNSPSSTRLLKDGLGRAIVVLTGQMIESDENIAEFLEQRLKIPKSKILDMTFNEWIDKLARNQNGYRAELIKVFKEKSVLLKALTAEMVYENIRFNSNNTIAYDHKKDANGNIYVRKTKFNISVIDSDGAFDIKNGFGDWLWIPFDYLP